jgi:type VI secretion system protein ImpA
MEQLNLSLISPPDLALIFQPLTPENPCGEDLRYDPVFDRIPELARSEPVSTSMGVWERENKKSDWKAVAASCHDVLTRQSKDLQVAAWYGEALIHLHGPRGAALGWHIFNQLALSFWKDIHPLIVEKDIEIRLRSVYWFSQQTKQWLSRLITPLPAEPELSAAPELTADEERTALQSLLTELMQFEAFLIQQLGDQAPLFNALTELTKQRLSALGVAPQLATDASGVALAEGLGLPLARSGAGHAVSTRDAAYGSLREVATYLRKFEPHSPVPMILDALVEWRDCQFNDLLERMPQDKASLYELLKFFKKP